PPASRSTVSDQPPEGVRKRLVLVSDQGPAQCDPRGLTSHKVLAKTGVWPTFRCLFRCMTLVIRRMLPQWGLIAFILLLNAALSPGQNPPTRARAYPPGSVQKVGDLPTGRFRQRLESLPETA